MTSDFKSILGSGNLFGVALACLACASSPVSVHDVMAEGRASQLAALAKYRGEEVTLRGYVLETGVKGVSRLKVHHAASAWGSADSEGGIARVPVPFAILADVPGPAADKAVCFFAEDGLSDAAELKVGQRVMLLGQFQEFRFGTPESLLVLNLCHRAP